MPRFQQQRHVLGSEAVLTVIVPNAQAAETLFDSLWEKTESFEQRFSRFRSHSELSKLNTSAGMWTPVSDEMRALLESCREMSRATGGLFNPFVLPALQKAGYKGSWPAPADFDAALDVSSRSVAGMDDLQIKGRQVLLPTGSALDFGGIGKGYLLDALGEFLLKQKVADFWLSLGGDILTHGHDSEGRDWEVGIASATQPGATVTSVKNGNGGFAAIASSGTTKRRGNDWHHIIDPRTGVSSTSPILVATVVTPRATEADVFAKCLVIDPDFQPMPSNHQKPLIILQTKDGALRTRNQETA